MEEKEQKHKKNLVDNKDDESMSFVDHFAELRKRLIYSMIIFVLAFVLCFMLSEHIYAFLAFPLIEAMDIGADRTKGLIFTQLTEVFFSYIKVSLFAAFCISFPFIANQFWRFIAPGLYQQEGKALLPFLLLTPLLFSLGAALAYYIVFPLAWKFFLAFEAVGDVPIRLEAKVNEYLSLSMALIMGFGISFLLPLLLSLLARTGVVNYSFLSAKRKYVLVIVFIAAALMTPPDIVSQILLALPLLVLYELSLLAIRMVEKEK